MRIFPLFFVFHPLSKKRKKKWGKKSENSFLVHSRIGQGTQRPLLWLWNENPAFHFRCTWILPSFICVPPPSQLHQTPPPPLLPLSGDSHSTQPSISGHSRHTRPSCTHTHTDREACWRDRTGEGGQAPLAKVPFTLHHHTVGIASLSLLLWEKMFTSVIPLFVLYIWLVHNSKWGLIIIIIIITIRQG